MNATFRQVYAISRALGTTPEAAKAEMEKAGDEGWKKALKSLHSCDFNAFREVFGSEPSTGSKGYWTRRAVRKMEDEEERLVERLEAIRAAKR